ncbi:MAG: type II toxin-antitoxin system RelE/ParE family toxin [Thermodesulfovibrionales bacterium]|nr:type II toxin-antitoxin system RelE/ParE family toxin [Thermodesulfovibrionales bacterium]
MDKYRIFETEQFLEDLTQDFEGQGERLRKKLLEYVYPLLRNNPYFGKNIKKLKNYKPDTWRYRIGDYRFFYEINEKERMVYMIAADSRKDSY